MVTTKRKVEMPAGIRNKLMAAVAMLLVATILMVSSTYAWFTLSTAPEVTGISTSVGANGNLEIALLTTDTYTAPGTISSAVGDSYVSTGKNATTANITWGNLVDLSDASYGLSGIALMPAALNLNGDALVPATLLKTPTYGPDGRVDQLAPNTVSAIKDAQGAFTYAAGTQTYGVRAVGTASNISPRQLAFNNAKRAISTNKAAAASALKRAVTANTGTLLVVAMAGSAPTQYTASQIAGLLAMTQGAKAALDSIVKAYANYAIASATSGNAALSDDALQALTALSNTTSASSLSTALTTAGFTPPAQLTNLATQQAAVDSAIDVLNNYTTNGANASEAATVNGAVAKLYETVTDNTGNALTSETASALLTSTEQNRAVYVTDDGNPENGSSAIGAIANEVGKLELAEISGVKAYAGAHNQATTGALDTVITTANSLPAPTDGAASSTITDAYGYVIDFAFRTNAADSYLRLQTEAANRVYSDGQTATQGSGSTVTYTMRSGMTNAQAEKLLGNIRIVFFSPADGTIYANARLDNITTEAGQSTAKIKLYTTEATTTITVGKDFYDQGTGENEGMFVVKNSLEINGVNYTAEAAGLTAGAVIEEAAYNVLQATSVAVTTQNGSFLAQDNANITALTQNEPMKVSVLVYLDGETIQNSDVINAADSGTLALNLQFSSSAQLVPMQNTALKNMTA